MDRNIWKQLPNSIKGEIFKRLSLMDIIKNWNWLYMWFMNGYVCQLKYILSNIRIFSTQIMMAKRFKIGIFGIYHHYNRHFYLNVFHNSYGDMIYYDGNSIQTLQKIINVDKILSTFQSWQKLYNLKQVFDIEADELRQNQYEPNNHLYVIIYFHYAYL